ncbi:MAG: hypothetical protein KDE34_17760 [Anaerolineales bacterium]|nr:hypothetical protein [Anaerolineales bacterium]
MAGPLDKLALNNNVLDRLALVEELLDELQRQFSIKLLEVIPGNENDLIYVPGFLLVDNMRIRDYIQLDYQKVFGFLNSDLSGYLFTISTDSLEELLLYDQGSKNDYRIRRTLSGGSVVDLMWMEYGTDESLLFIGLGPQGGLVALENEIGIMAKGASGGNTRLGIGTNSPTVGLDLRDSSDTVATLGDGTGPKLVTINGAAGQRRHWRILSNGSPRWSMGVDNSAESGSNAGSNFVIQNFSDAGGFLSNAISVYRSDGTIVFGSPAGITTGAGRVNAQAVYDDGTLLTPYVLEAALTGGVDLEALDTRVPNRAIPAKVRLIPAVTRTIPARKMKVAREADPKTGRPTRIEEITIPAREEVVEPEREEEIEPAGIEERTHGPARRFVANLAEELDPAQYAAKWRRLGHLPAFPSEAEWAAQGNFSIGDLLQRVMETVEVQAVHIAKLEARLAALEGAA